MKKLLLLTAICATTMLNAGMITSIQGLAAPVIPSKMSSIETAGQNPRGYIFTIKENDGAVVPMQCIIVYTEQDLGENKPKSTAPVMQCIKI